MSLLPTDLRTLLLDRNLAMQIDVVTDRALWDGMLLALPEPHVLQCFAWGEAKRATGWTPVRLRLHDGGQTIALAQVLRHRLPLPGLCVLYVPKGPLLAAGCAHYRDKVLEALKRFARRQRAIFLKTDADIPITDAAALRALLRAGFRPSPEQIQIRNSVVIDLRPEPEELLARMHAEWRRKVRLAARRGVIVRPGGLRDLPHFYDMYLQTGRRDGFVVRPYSYYASIWQPFLQEGLAHLLLAEVEGETIAGVMLFRFGHRAWYLYGADTRKRHKLMPNYLLQWEAMLWARAQGCTEYDLWGAPDRLTPDDPLWGVWEFKRGFGGRFVARLGAWDYAVIPSLYQLWQVVIPRYLALLRRLAGEPTLRPRPAAGG